MGSIKRLNKSYNFSTLLEIEENFEFVFNLIKRTNVVVKDKEEEMLIALCQEKDIMRPSLWNRKDTLLMLWYFRWHIDDYSDPVNENWVISRLCSNECKKCSGNTSTPYGYITKSCPNGCKQKRIKIHKSYETNYLYEYFGNINNYCRSCKVCLLSLECLDITIPLFSCECDFDSDTD
ncbi:ORF_102 [Adoxophyes orana granulovirus]|uniref:ORF_102 n=1 Tax=Adoxophyes orana granulovirus TaxID=170617 RepID=Q7T9R3_GVAO|nr:ORF_102 [Adoxophyes orana granulovirus]AAP85739.1 ORF_102 [Adoxophyes orana granulovirus]